MTYCSTAFAIINANLKPVLADIDYLKPTISINNIKKKLILKQSYYASTFIWFVI